MLHQQYSKTTIFKHEPLCSQWMVIKTEEVEEVELLNRFFWNTFFYW